MYRFIIIVCCVLIFGVSCGVASAAPVRGGVILADIIDWSGMYQWIIDSIKNFWGWFYDALMEFIWGCVDDVVSCIPSGWMPAFSGFAFWMSVANCWVPIDIGFGLLGIYFSFLIVSQVVKVICMLL